MRRWLPALVSLLGPLLLRLVHVTLRVRHVPIGRVESLRDSPDLRGPVLYAFWHQAQLIPAWTHRGRGIGILVSRHGDGELIARVVGRLGFHPIRGSTTRGGVSALKQIVREVRAGRDVAFTPDGPRGPRHRIQPGVIMAASLSGAPIVPVGIAVSRARRLRSWDRFLVPLPFATVVLRYGRPEHVPPDLDREGREEHLRRIERTMRDLTARTWRETRGRGYTPSGAGGDR
jgi:lysophospholipid acyltransferase (LPLAT)-like uncharacterized protein